MLRNILVVVLAFVAGAVVISIVQGVNWMLFPPPAEFDFSDPVAVKQMVEAMPLGAWIGLELSYAFGCLSAGLVIGAFSGSRPMLLAVIVGSIFTLAGFANMAMIPTPLVMAILTTVTYIPCTLLGASLTARRPGFATAGR